MLSYLKYIVPKALLVPILLTIIYSSITASTIPTIYYKVSYSIEVDSKSFEKEFFIIFYPSNRSIIINNTLLNQSIVEIKEYGIKIDLLKNEKDGTIVHDFTIQVNEELVKFDVVHITKEYGTYFIELYYELSSGILVQADIYDLREKAIPIGIIFLYNYSIPLNKINTLSTSPIPPYTPTTTFNTTTNTSYKTNQDYTLVDIDIIPLMLILIVFIIAFIILFKIKT